MSESIISRIAVTVNNDIPSEVVGSDLFALKEGHLFMGLHGIFLQDTEQHFASLGSSPQPP